MTSLHTISWRDVTPQPWKNGGGETRELLAWPKKAEWALRVSVADITKDGPFSAFSAINRWIAVLEGAGMRLGEPLNQVVTPDLPPYAFDGQHAVTCQLIDGPTRDLNVMIDSRFGRGSLTALPSNGDAATVASMPADSAVNNPNVVGVFAVNEIEITSNHQQFIAPPYSLVWSDDTAQPWRARFVGRAWILHCTLHKKETEAL